MDKELEWAIIRCLAEKRPQLSEDFWRTFAETPESEVVVEHHFGLGLHLRNYVLLPDNAIYKLFIREGGRRKDDMSSMTMTLWHRELNKQ